jgi:PAS domain S-box-containing protein
MNPTNLIEKYPWPVLILNHDSSVEYMNRLAIELFEFNKFPIESTIYTEINKHNSILRIDGISFYIQDVDTIFWNDKELQLVFLQFEEHLTPNMMESKVLHQNQIFQIRFDQYGKITYANQSSHLLRDTLKIDQFFLPTFFEQFGDKSGHILTLGQGNQTPITIEQKIDMDHREDKWIQWKIYSLNHGSQFEALGMDISETKWNEQVQKTLYEISQATIHIEQLDDFYKHVHQTVDKILPAKNLYIALLDPQTNCINFVYFQDELDDPPPPIPIGNSLTAYVMRNGEPLLLSDFSDEDVIKKLGVAPNGTSSCDWLGVPLRQNEHTIGTLAIQTYDPNIRYNQNQVEVLEFVSSQIAQSIVRKQAEEARRINEERYRTLFDSFENAVFLESKDGKILEANFAASKMYGYSPEEFQYLSSADLIPAEIRDQLPIILQTEQSSKYSQHENLGLRKNGEIFPTLVNTGLIYINDEEQVVVSIKDQSKEKDYEERLFLQGNILKSIANAVVITDTKGVITWVNDAFTKLSGYQIEETVGKTSNILKSGKQNPSFYKKMWQTIQSGEVWIGEMINRRKNGDLYYEEMTITPVKNIHEQITHYVAVKQEITERKKHQSELEAIASMTSALRNAITQEEILEAILSQLMDLIQEGGAVIALNRPEVEEIMIELGIGEWQSLTNQSMPIYQGVSGYVALSGDVYIDNNAPDNTLFYYPDMLHHISAIGAAPLYVHDKTIGALVIGTKDPIGDEEIRLLITISNLVSSVIHRANLHDQIQDSYLATIQGWAQALELRDKETKGHSFRLIELTRQLAQQINYPKAEMENLINGAILHDIGKMGIPDDILFKPGALNAQEWEKMKQHPVYARDMLENIPYLRPAIKVAYYHHEHWDGSGYPEGLSGEVIPIEGRLFAVLDVWDALTHDRPYRPAWDKQRTLVYIQERSGTQFDPAIVTAFIKMMNE